MHSLSNNTGATTLARPVRLQHLEKLPLFQSFSPIFLALTGNIPRIYGKSPSGTEAILEFEVPSDFLPAIPSEGTEGGQVEKKENESLITLSEGMKREFLVPILSDGRFLGYLRSGSLDREEPSDSWEKRSNVEAQKRLMVLCAELIGKSALDMGLTDRENIPKAVEEAARYINENRHDAGLQLRDVSKKFGVSQSYLTELLKKHYGANYREFINRCRIREASERLELNANERISEIAYGVGFHTLSHFNRAFRKVTGMTPSAYRRAAANPRISELSKK